MEKTVWQTRGSMRAALPSLFKLAIMTSLVSIIFQVGLRRLPLLACLASERTCVDMDATIAARIWGVASWIELALIGLLFLGFLKRVLRARSLKITVTNHRILSEHGVLSRRIDELDLGMIQDTAMAQGVIERLLGLGRVIVLSRDRTHPRLVLHNMRAPEQLREVIRTQAQALRHPKRMAS